MMDDFITVVLVVMLSVALIGLGSAIGRSMMADRACKDIGWTSGEATGLHVICARTDEVGVTTEAPLSVIWEMMECLPSSD